MLIVKVVMLFMMRLVINVSELMILVLLVVMLFMMGGLMLMWLVIGVCLVCRLCVGV